MATMTWTTEDYEALVAERENLRGEVRLLKLERDLLQEKLQAFLRKRFDAKSEARGTDQKDLFFNEAEALMPTPAHPVAEEIEVAGHSRKKRGRKRKRSVKAVLVLRPQFG